jgi:alpha-tubulin suppressor-like RCC1 family protein
MSQKILLRSRFLIFSLITLTRIELGDVYAWGRGKEGQIGNGTRDIALEPQRIQALKHERIVKACTGNWHCVAITDTGRVYQWGRLYHQGTDSSKQYFGFAVKMVGMKTQEMVDRSIQDYFKGKFIFIKLIII